MHNQAMARQRGVATLVVSVGVALLMAVAAVGMMRSGMLEQKIAANDIRAREAQEIAQAGLESIMASSYVPAQACVRDANNILDLRDGKLGAFNGIPSVPNSQSQQTSQESYTQSIKGCYFEGRYFARSQVKLNAEPVKTEYFVEAWFQRSSLINNEMAVPPLFFIKGNFCSGGCNNSAKIFESYGTSDLEDSPGVIATGTINVNGIMPYEADEGDPGSNAFGGKSAWDYVFPGIKLADAKIKANQKSDDGWFYLNDNVHGNYGNSITPVIIIVGEKNGNCVNINGDAVIYGIVYFENGCKANGWGNAKIYGSVVSDGDFDKLTAHSEHRKLSESSWNKLKEANSDGVFVIPGTWKDF